MSEGIKRIPATKPGAGDLDIVALSRRVEELSRQLSEAERPHLSSRLVEADLVTGSTNNVEHGLDRDWRGFCVCNIDASANVYEDTSSTAEASRFLPLLATANCTVTLMVW